MNHDGFNLVDLRSLNQITVFTSSVLVTYFLSMQGWQGDWYHFQMRKLSLRKVK